MARKKTYSDLITSLKVSQWTRLRVVLLQRFCSKDSPYISTSSEPGLTQVKCWRFHKHNKLVQ
jgi:hypothetical protein